MKSVNHFHNPLLHTFPPSYIFQDKNLKFIKTIMKIRLGFNLNFKVIPKNKKLAISVTLGRERTFISSHFALFSAQTQK